MNESKKLGNQVLNGLFWKFMERICAQVVTFVVSIILARLLAPSDYGAISIVLVFINIANVFVSAGFGNALVQKQNADNIDFSTVFYFNIVFSFFIAAIVVLCAPLVSAYYEMPILTPVLRVLSIKIVLAGINSVQQAYVSKNMLFLRFFWSTIIGTAISAVVGITMAYLGYGIWALVGQYLTNSFIDTFVLWITVKWRPVRQFVGKRLIPLIGFGWKLLAEQLVTTIYNNLKSLVICKVYTSEDLAYYTKGVQFPDLLVTNINSSISAVLFPALSKIQSDRTAIKNSLQKSIRVSSFFLSPALAGLFVVAPTFVTLLLTDKWIEAVPFLRIACVYYAFFPMTVANLEAILAIGRSDISLRLTAIKRIVGILLIMASIRFGVWAVAASELVMVLFAVVLNTYYNNKFFDYPLMEQMKDISISFVSSIIMGIIVYLFGMYINIQFDALKLLIQIFVGIVSYAVISWVVNKKDVSYCLKMIKGYFRKNEH